MRQNKPDSFTYDICYGKNSLSFNADCAKDGILFLPVNNIKGWNVKVDGKTVSPKSVIGSFVGIEVNRGTHRIDMKYYSPGFVSGIIVSVLSAMLLICLIYCNNAVNAAAEKNRVLPKMLFYIYNLAIILFVTLCAGFLVCTAAQYSVKVLKFLKHHLIG